MNIGRRGVTDRRDDKTERDNEETVGMHILKISE